MNIPPMMTVVSDAVRARAHDMLRILPQGWSIKFQPPRRTLDQNAAQWPYLAAFSEQLQWPVDGELVFMTDEEWKDVLTAAFRRETIRLARGLDGGIVMLGLRTSKFSKADFSEWIEFLKATAAMRGVFVYPEDIEAMGGAPAARPKSARAAANDGRAQPRREEVAA